MHTLDDFDPYSLIDAQKYSNAKSAKVTKVGQENTQSLATLATLAVVNVNSRISKSEVGTTDDWQYFYNERATILEYDGRHTRQEAECIAYEICIVRWLNENPPEHDDINTCPQCRRPNGKDTIPVLKKGGHIWLHGHCHTGWLERRRQEAREVLTDMGLSHFK